MALIPGFFKLAGELPVQGDGGMKSCGHLIGVSRLRIMQEIHRQVRGQMLCAAIAESQIGTDSQTGRVPYQR